jgi:carboxypeptidase C (cathepsin A)
MKKMLFSLVLTGSFLTTTAQTPTKKTDTPAVAPAEKVESLASNIKFNPDEKVITQHLTTIKGQKVPYQATTGTMPVWDEDGKTIAGIFYTYYERSDVNDRAKRPLVISFNGGPGSASVWMQIA